MESLNQELFNRLFSRKYSYRDQKLIQDGFEDQEKINEIKKIAGSQWNAIMDQKDFASIDLNNIFYKLYHQINESRKSNIRLQLWNSFSRIAAVLFIPLLLISAYFYYSNQFVQENKIAGMSISAPDGIRSQFVLPDGSTGWLNGGSQLEYISNNSDVRNVKLTGEAFFDVVKDTKRPFIVDAGTFNVKVHGTRFNIYSYPDEDWADLVLESGKVTVSDSNKEVELNIIPGQRFTLNKNTKKYKVEETNVTEYIDWIEGKLFLRNEPMSLVVKKLGRYYNADIEIADKEILDLRFRALLQDETLEEVIQFMELTLPLRATIIPRKKQDDGTISKQKIIFKKI